MSALLSVSGLVVEAEASRLVDGVDLEVPMSGVTALLGRNGAGKTTTLRAILGLRPRHGRGRISGRVELAGERLDGRLTHDIVRAGVGYVPEDRGIFAALTVAENLRLAEPRSGAARYEMVHDLFPLLRERAAQPAGTLSGGQQQMLALGRVLLAPKRLLLIDEPTKGMAPTVVAETAAALARVAETVPVLLVEQSLAVVRRLAATAVVLESGRVAHAGLVTELFDDADRTRELLGVGRSR